MAAVALVAIIPSCAYPGPPLASRRIPSRAPDLLAATLDALRMRIPDLSFDPAFIADVRTRFEAAPDAPARRRVVRSLLARVPTSHLALFSSYAHDHFEHELRGEIDATLGFSLVRIGDTFRIAGVLAGSPAETAGIVRGDRLLSLDGIAVAESPRLDARHDDAAAPPGSSIDPETESAHLVMVAPGERVTVVVAKGGPGSDTRLAVELPVVETSTLASDRARVRVVPLPVSIAGREGEESATVAVGVLPFSYIYSRGSSNHFAEAFLGPLREIDALVLDLRGRGGSGLAMTILTSYLTRDTYVGDLPIVATIDRRTRSAKEVLARTIREKGVGVLVGEHTPGAVRGCGWVELVDGEWLLCPNGPIGRDPRGLEGVGVAPDIVVADPFPEGDGADPILAAALEEAARRVLASAVTSGRGSPPSPGSPPGD